MEAEDGDAPFVDDCGVDLAEGLLVGNHLTASAESDGGSVGGAASLLERNSVAFVLGTDSVESADGRHVAAASELDVIAAEEIVLLSELPPGHVEVHASRAVMIVRRHLYKLREIAGQVASDGIGKVAADDAGGVGESVGKAGGARVQEEARGFAGAGGDYEGFGTDALFGAGGLVDVGDGFDLAVFAEDELTGHGVGDQRESAGGFRRGNHDLAGAEVGGGETSASALN